MNLIYFLIALNLIISIRGFNNYPFFEKFKFNISAVQAGQYYRMLSSGFLHVDWMHLIFNMYALYLFGPIVIEAFGSFGFLLIYFLSLFGSSWISLRFHKNQFNYSAVGASGAVSGVLYAAVLAFPSMTLVLFPIPIPLPAFIFALAYMVYSIYGMRTQNDNIGHAAHLGGAAFGLVLSLVLRPDLFVSSPIISVVLLGSLVLIYMLRNLIFK